ncbi:MAG: hypothetical protein B9S32_07300 [Verrucomicrobia bacterium Tous-C9LFEB]|nr:MAG: hypothetical protein B9S32_07300 [Verrucomicrobia bacterium Tous-C9LFEB]
MANSPAQPNILGRRIQTLRKKVNFSQKQLVARIAANGVEMDRTALARIENYDRSLRDFEVAAIAKALRVPVAELYKE